MVSLQQCRYCGRDLPSEAFEICRVVNGKPYRRRKCQQCKSRTTNDRRSKLRSWIEVQKRDLACERCGFSDFRALEFHHRAGSGKSYNVGDMAKVGFSIATIQQEIDKCLVLCSNCHRIEHYPATHLIRSAQDDRGE